jgi:hypothetical protein
MTKTIQEQLKEILVGLAVRDQLPMDLTRLNPEVFDEVIEPLLTRLNDLEYKEGILDQIYDNHPQIAEMYPLDEEDEEEPTFTEEEVRDFLQKYGTPGNDIEAELAVNLDMIYLHKYDTWIHEGNMLWSEHEESLAKYLAEHNPAPEI